MKPTVFISHIDAEAEVAAWIKEKLDALLYDRVDFFLSSEATSMVGEDRWLNRIDLAIKDAALVLILCSEDSVSHPWINFFAGGAWSANKRLVLVCHSGLAPNNLSQPLAGLKAYPISNPDDLKIFVKLIAFATGVTPASFDAAALFATFPAKERESAEQPYPSRRNSDKEITDRGNIAGLRSNYEFDKRAGIHRHNRTGEAVCTACLLEGIESPLTEYEVGWLCNRRTCEKFFSNPDFYPAGSEMDYDPFNRRNP